jgi:membrane complex biogenesis BtpA family protein
MAEVLDRARRDAVALRDGGVDAILVENYGDSPFHKDRVDATTVAAMTRAVAVVAGLTDLPIGINVLRNDARAALSVAAATDAGFIRVNVHTGGMFTDQGWIEGRAAETLRLRERVAPAVGILADVFVKHAVPPQGLEIRDAARDAWFRGMADALIVSGPATGAPTDPDTLRAVVAAVPDAPVFVGSGVTPETVGRFRGLAAGVIVGSAIQVAGAGSPVDVERVRSLVDAAG